jgi:hypothetical protein
MPRWFLSTRAQSVGGPVSPVKILDADRPGYSGDLMPDLLAAIRGREVFFGTHGFRRSTKSRPHTETRCQVVGVSSQEKLAGKNLG